MDKQTKCYKDLYEGNVKNLAESHIQIDSLSTRLDIAEKALERIKKYDWTLEMAIRSATEALAKLGDERGE